MDALDHLIKHIHNLPGERAHLEMYPDRARTSEALKAAENVKLSAVMALTYFNESQFKLILIQRPIYDGNHSGQIGFPGGKFEDSDIDLLTTAYRETSEEIGISTHQIKLIGNLSDVYIPVSNFLVKPYLGFLNEKPTYVIEPREVAHVVEIDVLDILKTESLIKTNISIQGGMKLKNVPAFQINGHIIWGATALMLNEVKHILRQK